MSFLCMRYLHARPCPLKVSITERRTLLKAIRSSHESLRGFVHPSSLRERWKGWWGLLRGDPDAPVPVWSALMILWGQTQGVRLFLIAGLVCLMTSAGCEVAIPHLTSKVLGAAQEAILASDGPSMGTSVLHMLQAPPAAVVDTILTLSLVCLAQTVFASLRAVCASLATAGTVKRLRSDVFAALLQQEASWFQKPGRESAAVASRIANDCDAVSRILSVKLNVALRHSVQAVGGLAYLTFINPLIGFGSLLVSAVMAAFSLKYGSFTRQVTRTERSQTANLSSMAEESFHSIGHVKAHGYEKSELHRLRRQLQLLVNLAYLKLVGYASFQLAYHGTWHIGTIFVLYFGGCMGAYGHLNLTQLASVFLYSDLLFSSVKAVCDQTASVLESIGTVDAVLKMLVVSDSKRVRDENRPNLQPPPDIWDQGLTLDNVSFVYPDRKRVVLQQLSAVFPAGSSTAIVGMSGAGKSTVARLLTRVLQPTSGRVRLGPVDLQDIDRNWLQQYVAEVPQTSALFTTTVFENISYGFPDATQEQVEAAARAANAHDFIRRMPQGYQTRVRASLLSGGQGQRIAIARALFRKPRVLVLDEATSALDAATESAVQETFDKVIGDSSLTVVMIAHRLATIQRCSNIIVLHQGSVSAVGTHDDLIAAGGLYADLVARQSLHDSSCIDSDGMDIKQSNEGSTDNVPMLA